MRQRYETKRLEPFVNTDKGHLDGFTLTLSEVQDSEYMNMQIRNVLLPSHKAYANELTCVIIVIIIIV